MKQIKSTFDMITLLTDERITGTHDFSGEFMLSPATLGRENLGQNPLSRLSREQLAAFLETESGNARSAHFNVPPAEPTPPRKAPIGRCILTLTVGLRHMIFPGRTPS